MGLLIPLVTEAVHTERTTVAHVTVETVPDATLQLRLAPDLDIHAAPGEHLAVPLTRDQAEDLLHALAARLGHRLLRIQRRGPAPPTTWSARPSPSSSPSR
ncbi:hypothetical protein PUR61_42430 [Streptomyces sp. BE20]|uniref:hypothetical protein n=1 Tax=Streptomyces sp. BE20 TaxID=3002525 RepID=UPI002E7679FD|nr:hypothetical protein [Streptomyces sp. BE20]MEE1828776.1 hypothetical protein [Streptomyces sp. BE20]